MSASSKKKLRKEQEAAVLTEKQLAEQKEAKKLKMYTMGFAAVMILILCLALGTMGWQAISNSGIIQRNTKALTVGEHDLSTAQLSYYYVDEINNNYSEWRNAYGDNAALYMSFLYGLDLSKPLDQQHYDTEGKVTWAEFFANNAVETARSQYALYDAAVAAGHKLTEEEQAAADSSLESAETYATLLYGFSNLKDYLKSVYGSGATVESFKEYLEVGALASSYYNAHKESLSYDEAAVKAFDAENGKEYDSYSYTSFYIPDDDFLTGTTDSENKTTYTDEDRAKALTDAKAAAESIAAANIADLAQMNAAIKAIPAYAEKESAIATENKDVLYGNIDSSLVEWLSAGSRIPGDVGIVPRTTTSVAEHDHDEDVEHEHETVTTTEGYYVVLFNGKNNNTTALKNVRHILAEFEGGTTDSTTGKVTYTDAEKKAAKDAITEILNTYNAGEKTEETFAALATEKTEDTGSAANGGLYENVYPGQMVESFEDWCYAANRKSGDVEIIESEFGYHLMYFVGDSDTTYREYMIKNDMTEKDMTAWFDALVEKAPAENINISGLDLDLVIQPQTATA